VTHKETPPSREGGAPEAHGQANPLAVDSTASTPPEGFRSFADLLRDPPPRLDWQLKPVLPQGAFGVLAAPRKYGGKSWFSLDVALSTAIGIPAFGGSFPTLGGPVITVTPEHGELSLRRRGHAVKNSFGDAFTSDFQMLWYRTQGVRFLDRDDVAGLDAACQQLIPKLLVLDPAFKALEGADFSQLAEIGAVVSKIQDVAGSVGAAVLVSHHTVKRADARGLDRLSGVGLAEAADVVLVGDRKSYHVVGGRTVQVVRWEVEGRDIPGFTFDLSTEIGPVDPDDPEGPLEYSASVSLVGEEEDAESDELSFVQRRVLDVIRSFGSTGVSIRDIGDGLAADGKGKPLRRETIARVLDELVEAGLIDETDGTWWAAGTRPVQASLGGED
jgi:hypothetical protein